MDLVTHALCPTRFARPAFLMIPVGWRHVSSVANAAFKS